jgi:hypothetical protein
MQQIPVAVWRTESHAVFFTMQYHFKNLTVSFQVRLVCRCQLADINDEIVSQIEKGTGFCHTVGHGMYTVMLIHCVTLVKTNILEEHSISIIRVTWPSIVMLEKDTSSLKSTSIRSDCRSKVILQKIWIQSTNSVVSCRGTPQKQSGNKFRFLCKIMLFNVHINDFNDINDLHAYIEHSVCCIREIHKILKTAQTIMKWVVSVAKVKGGFYGIQNVYSYKMLSL